MMDNLAALTAALTFGSLGLIAFFLVANALFPQRVARTRGVAAAYPGRSFVVGLVNLIFASAVASVIFAINERVGGLLAIPGVFVVTVLTVGLLFGLAGLVQLVGERMAAEQSAVRRTVWGTLALAWACALPFVGWFILLPYAGALGLGAFVLSFFYTASRPDPAAPEVPAA